MRRFALLTVLAAAIAGAYGPVSPAVGAPIRECGRVGGSGYSVFNITSRVTSCATARRVARKYPPRRLEERAASLGPTIRRGSYSCRWQSWGVEGVDMRCTASGGRVVRWQASS